jgi:TctA family transporter
MALIIGALILQGISPGPSLATQQPALFWGVIVSMWVGNLMLLVLNLPLIGLWIKLLEIPQKYLLAPVLTFAAVGVFSVGNSEFDLYLMAGFGVLGYVLHKLECEPAPLLLGFVLGPMLEEYLRRSMILSRGDGMVFFQRPLSASILLVAAIVLLMVLLPAVRNKRKDVFVEEP